MACLAVLRSALLACAVTVAVCGPMAHAEPAPDMTAGKPAKPLHWLDALAFAPDHILPEPAPVGSPEQQAEMATVRAFATTASPERHAAAEADGEDETVRAFNTAAGRDLTALPATAHLIELIEQDVEAVADNAKRRFHRPRPYIVDPTLVHCGKEGGKGGDRSYPSGHATFGWSAAWVLADLIPERRAALLARARDYGFSREICAVHYPSDIEAGHVLGVLTASALLADPRLARKVAAARAELARH